MSTCLLLLLFSLAAAQPCYFNWVQDFSISHSGPSSNYDVLVQLSPTGDALYLSSDFDPAFLNVRFRYPHANQSLGWLDFWVEAFGTDHPDRTARVWLKDVPLTSTGSNYVQMYWLCHLFDGTVVNDVSVYPSYGTILAFDSGNFFLPVASTVCPSSWDPVSTLAASGNFIRISNSATEPLTPVAGAFESHGHEYYSAGGTFGGGEARSCRGPYGGSTDFRISCDNHFHSFGVGFDTPEIELTGLPETRPPHVEAILCSSDVFEMDSAGSLIVPIRGSESLVTLRGVTERGFDDGTFLLLRNTISSFSEAPSLGGIGHSHGISGNLSDVSEDMSCPDWCAQANSSSGQNFSFIGHRHSIAPVSLPPVTPLRPPPWPPADEINIPPHIEIRWASPSMTSPKFNESMMIFTSGTPPAGLVQMTSSDGAFLRGVSMPSADIDTIVPVQDHAHEGEMSFGGTFAADVEYFEEGFDSIGVVGWHQHLDVIISTEFSVVQSDDIDRIDLQLWGYPSDLKLAVGLSGVDIHVPYDFCYGFFVVEPGVCSQRGDCVDGECVCWNSSWGGVLCDVAACHGRPADAPDVCGPSSLGVSKGVCTDGLCTCDDDDLWTGEQCDSAVCAGLVDPEACGGELRGQCTSPGTCSCNEHFAGVDCMICEEGYSGPDCVLDTGLSLTTIGGIAGGAVAGVLIVVCLVIAAAVFVCVVLRKPSGGKGNALPPTEEGVGLDDLDRLEAAEAENAVAKLNIDHSLFEIQYDDLTVEKSIGQGGSSATVFKATWNRTTVAFKVFKLQDFLDSNKFKEFENEVKILASLSHPNILRFYGACLHVPRVGIVLEYCAHGDCEDYLHSHPETPLLVRLSWLRGVASALAFVHTKSIIHRDIKPQNVLLAKKTLVAKLMDFGLGRVVDSVSQVKTVRIGTAFYMAPELTLGGGQYSNKVDVFSFGVMIHTLVTSEFAPYGPSSANIELKVANDPDCRPSFKSKSSEEEEFPPFHIPDDVIDLAKESWADDPDDRPTCEQIVARLREICEKIELGGKGKTADCTEDDESQSSSSSSSDD